MGWARRRQGGALRRGPRRRRRAALRPVGRQRPGRSRGACWTEPPEHGTPGLVIDQPGSIAQLALAVARTRQVPVAYVPGLVMRRAADLYPGEAKTDRRDAFVIADTGRTRRKQVHWLDAGSDELLDRLRVLNGFDIDLGRGSDPTRQPAPRRSDQRLSGPGAGVGRPSRSRWGSGPAGQVPDARRALQAAGRSSYHQSGQARSPRLAPRSPTRSMAALEAQSVTVPAEAAIGRVIAELAGELDRVYARRDALAGEIEEVFVAHPFGELLPSLPGIGPRTGAEDPGRDRRRLALRERRQAGLLRRARPGHPPVWQVHQRRIQESAEATTD